MVNVFNILLCPTPENFTCRCGKSRSERGTELAAVSVKFNQIIQDNMPNISSVSLGVYILNLRKTWEKLLLAARIIVAIENPAVVCVISARPYSQV